MTFELELDRLAIHYIDREQEKPDYDDAEKDVETLHEEIVQFFLDMAAEVWNAPDTGSTRSANFVEKAENGLKPSESMGHIENIIKTNQPNGFFAASKKLAKLLHKNTPKQVKKPYLLAILRLTTPQEDNKEDKNEDKNEVKNVVNDFIVILKIRYDNEKIVRALDNDLTELEVETIKNMLLRGIQKGACIPHPQLPEYHLKVIDKQLADDPARYFTEKFLGCTTRRSYAYQTRRLLPTLRQYAVDNKLNLANEKLPTVVKDIQKRKTNVTPKVLLDVVKKHEVYDKAVDPAEFTSFIEDKKRLGPLNIPKTVFAERGVTVKKPRKVTYKFRAPLSGVTLSGPPKILEGLTEVNGQAVTITIETTRSGYTVDYD